jgi:hypothetical protein
VLLACNPGVPGRDMTPAARIMWESDGSAGAVGTASHSSMEVSGPRFEPAPSPGWESSVPCCRRVAAVIGAVVFDVGECLVDETREYGTWADWLGVPRHVFSAVFGAVIARGQDLRACTVRVRAAYVERSTGEMVLGPPKSRAGRRIVGIPGVIIPALREHLAAFVKEEPGALVFPGQMGGPLRRGNFNKMSGWPHAARAIDMEGLHFHELRHAGNHLAATSGGGTQGPNGADGP